MADLNNDPSVLCVDIGGTSTRVGVATASKPAEVLESIPSQGPVESFVSTLCERLISVRGLTKARGDVSGVGIAVAGFLDESRRRMIYNSNLAWLESYPLKDRIARELNTPVELEVDSNAAALAEGRLGSGRDAERFLCITVGTGVGVGMLVHDEPLRFAYGCLGDPGHIIVQPNGPACTCGGRGCVEILVSAPMLAQQYRAQGGPESAQSLRHVIEAARSGDELARTILRQAGEWLGIATASLANIFLPDRIAFAGGFIEAGELVMNSIETSFAKSVSHFARARATLCRAKFGAFATLIGAAYSVLPARFAAERIVE